MAPPPLPDPGQDACLTPLERLEVLQDWVDGITELRNGRVAER